jgi:hypothetical protein
MSALRSAPLATAALLSLGGSLGACALLVGPIDGHVVWDGVDSGAVVGTDDGKAPAPAPEAGADASKAPDAASESAAPVVDSGGGADAGPEAGDPPVDAGFNGMPIPIAMNQGTPQGIVVTAEGVYWSNVSDATLRRLALDSDGTPVADAGVTTVFTFAEAGAAAASDLILDSDGRTLYAVVGPSALQSSASHSCRTYVQLTVPGASGATCAKPTNLCNTQVSIASRVAVDPKYVFMSGGSCNYVLGQSKPATDPNSWKSYGTLSDQAIALASDGNYLFFGVGNEVSAQSSGGGSSTALATLATSVADLLSDGTRVYWASSGSLGSIESLTPSSVGDPPLVHATKQVQPQRLSQDDKNIYWTTGGATSGEGSIGMAAKDGSITGHTLAGSQASPWAVAVGSKAIYWTNSGDGTVMMLRR